MGRARIALVVGLVVIGLLFALRSGALADFDSFSLPSFGGSGDSLISERREALSRAREWAKFKLDDMIAEFGDSKDSGRHR